MPTTSQRTKTRKEAVAQIAAENRAYFAKLDKHNHEPAQNQTPKTFANKFNEASLSRIDLLESKVRKMLEERFASYDDTSLFQIISFKLKHVAGIQYMGKLHGRHNGENVLFDVIVSSDGQNVTIHDGIQRLPHKARTVAVIVLCLIVCAAMLLWNIDTLLSGKGDTGSNAFFALLLGGLEIYGFFVLTKIATK